LKGNRQIKSVVAFFHFYPLKLHKVILSYNQYLWGVIKVASIGVLFLIFLAGLFFLGMIELLFYVFLFFLAFWLFMFNPAIFILLIILYILIKALD